MGLSFTQVDAFAARPFTGNPAAVFILDEFPSDEFMGSVAEEMNLSETAFAVREKDHSFRLRWFTPVDEVDLCGHATLAAAHSIFEAGMVSTSVIRFQTKSGELRVERGADGSLTMDFPVEKATEKPWPAGLESMLGAPVAWYGENRMDALVQLEEPGWVRSLDPDLNAVARLPVRGLIVTALSDIEGVDFISRFFAPQAGIPEDPVTGSAHCALAPFWHQRLGRPKLTGYQTSARGGRVGVELVGDRVSLTGGAITIARGELLFNAGDV